MHYMGGKSAIAKPIAAILRRLRKPGQTFLEPFVGGCNIVPYIPDGVRICADANPYLITMYQALQNGWIPPSTMSREEWQAIRDTRSVNNPLTAFAGFGCCYGGKWWHGYIDVRPNGALYATNAQSSLLRIAPRIRDVTFLRASYDEFHPTNHLIYCDPPYAGTTKYGALDEFDHDLFWSTMREWAKSNTVVISEYQAPPNFVAVWQQRKTTGLRNKEGKGCRTIECLFMHESQAHMIDHYKLTTQGELL